MSDAPAVDGRPLVTLDDGECVLNSPTAMPQASAFLWNPHLMIQVSCRGYAVAQFMQPEPGRYDRGPALEGQTFMQPELAYYAHHPGRFVYVKDEQTRELFSVPYDPVRRAVNRFRFLVKKDTIEWRLEHHDLAIRWSLTLAANAPVELWTLSIENASRRIRWLSVYPYFPIGYLSWMNQGAAFDEGLNAVVARFVTPYQRSEDYPRIRGLKDRTFLVARERPDAWETRQAAFEGEGGLHAPGAIRQRELNNGVAHYERPTAAMQYRLELGPSGRRELHFAFGPAGSRDEIARVQGDHLASVSAAGSSPLRYCEYATRPEGCLKVETPDSYFDRFVNDWLDRQVRYHGQLHRLTTDPQTRNYLQDAMGMCYVAPASARSAILHALAQQKRSGAMPDGILRTEDAQLKYINQVPHTDHCVWLPLCLRAYVDETADRALLAERMGFADGEASATVFEHVTLAVRWLLARRDARGLSFIEQGDWCDPMNMVGPRGQGVSGWLTLATAYAARTWSVMCEELGERAIADELAQGAEACNRAVDEHLWDGRWYGRGITDDGVTFGVASDREGRIYLNPQSWAMLSGAATAERQRSIIAAIERHLQTPFGVESLAPAYTEMREDVGRLTQKYPGVAENGAVYNHAVAFYIRALYAVGEGDRAFGLMRRMIPGPDEDDLRQRGQLPVFIPNYYRGAYRQLPGPAGRSSQLVHTGTVHWLYACLIDGLFGVRGDARGLTIDPTLPSKWGQARVQRRFRGARFDIAFQRDPGVTQVSVVVDGAALPEPCITEIMPGRAYQVTVRVPPAGR